MGAWLTIQNEKVTCNYCGASEPFYLHSLANFVSSHYRCAAQQNVQRIGGDAPLEDSPFETGIRRGAVVLPPANR